MANEQKLKLCKDALYYVLIRIRDDKKVAYLLGAGTETFSRLTSAYAAVMDEPVDTIRELIIPGSAALHRGS
jgi:hypothetical protein